MISFDPLQPVDATIQEADNPLGHSRPLVANAQLECSFSLSLSPTKGDLNAKEKDTLSKVGIGE